VNFLKGFTKHLTIRLPARRAYSSERRKRQILPGLSSQFFSEVFSERIQVNILYISMEQMIVSFFGCAFGLPGQDPVGGFVAGAFKPIFSTKVSSRYNG
jgi:hypothetical protein